jgi:hypothetical protein
MTTSWAYATHGQWKDALRMNVGGTLPALAAAATSVGALITAVRGHWLLRQPSEAAIIALVALATAFVLGEWMARLWMG